MAGSLARRAQYPRGTRMTDVRQCARTPAWLFAQLDSEYHFDVDAAADPRNALCSKYWDVNNSAFMHEWMNLRIWCNPPYRLPGAPISLWVEKALQFNPPQIAVFLLPATVSARWFHKALVMGEVHFFTGRIQFNAPPGIIYRSSNDRDSCLLVLGREAEKNRVRRRCAKTGVLL
jgi:phage N-6-adenine-methyltransferase